MSIFSRVLPFLLFTGSVQATTLSVTGYLLMPYQQQVLYSVHLGLGYPLGDADVNLTLDCHSGKVDMRQLNTDNAPSLPGQPLTPAETALRKAVLASGLVTVKPGVLTLKVTGDTALVNQCQHGVLDAALLDNYVLGTSRHLEVQIASEAGSQDDVPHYLTLRMDAQPVTSHGYSVSTFTVDRETYGPLPLPTAQMMVSDGKVAYPIFYGGLSQSNASLGSLTVPSTIFVYSTLDGKTWRKTSIDLAKRRIQTAPVSKPTLPIRS